MKKVGILTFHQASNYGAVLQAYALKEYCNNKGYEAHVVDYVTPAMRSTKNKKGFKSFIYTFVNKKGNEKRNHNFVAFRNSYFNLSDTCENEDDILNLGYDYYISGSDQIWNYRITNGFDPVYFGSLTNNHSKSIVYAASSQDVPFPQQYEILLKQLLQDKENISIREEQLKNYIEKVMEKKYPLVCDPVILGRKDILEKVNTHKDFGEYILIYQIDRNPNSDITRESLEKKFKCKVLSMQTPRMGKQKNRMGYVGPDDFLALIEGAKAIVTNSFHGVAISLLYEKNIFVYSNNGVMNRIDSLLEKVDLLDRKVKYLEDINLSNLIDYAPVREKLTEMREESMQFLNHALDE